MENEEGRPLTFRVRPNSAPPRTEGELNSVGGGDETEELEALGQELDALEKEDPSFFEQAADLAGKVGKDVAGAVTSGEVITQPIRGAQEAVNETADLAYAGVRETARWLGYELDPENPVRFPDQWMPGKAETVTGNLINDVSQFAVGFVGAGKFMAAAKLGQAASVAGRALQGAAKGAAADFTVFDPHEERLSDFIQAYPALQNDITEYLASDPTDGEAEGRFKNAVEGLGLGAVVEMLSLSLKGIRAARAGNADEAVAAADELDAKLNAEAQEGQPEFPGTEGTKEADEAAQKAPEGEEQLDLGLDGGGAGKDSPRPEFDENPTAEAPEFKRKVRPGTPDFKPIEKKIVVDEEKLRELVSVRIRETAYRGGEDVSGIRTDLIENGDDLKGFMDAARIVYREEMEKNIGNGGQPRSKEQVYKNVERLADIVGDDPRLMLQRMSNTHKRMEHFDAELRLYEDFLTTTGSKLSRLADIVDDPRGGTGPYKNRAELMEAFAQHYELMANVQLYYKGIQTGAARGMNAMRWGGIDRKALLAAGDGSIDQFFKGGEREMIAAARRIRAAGKDPKKLAKATRGGLLNNVIGSGNEYFINSILSGLKTHAVNIGSSALNSAFLPAERMLAGALRAGTQQGRQEFTEAALQYAGMAASMKDALVLAGKALKLGDNVLDPSNKAYEVRHAISRESWGVSNPIMGAIVDGLGTTVRMPSRFLTAEDEFFKQLNYRGEIRARAYREGVTKGLHKNPKEFAALIHQRLDEAVKPDGTALDQRALTNAREATFTSGLQAATKSGNPTWGESIQRLTAAHPTAQIVVPFVRTPTNIMRFVWNRTPGLNYMRQQYQDDILGKNGPQARGKAWSQMITGGLIWGTAINYVADGEITGAAPRNPEVRKALLATGWRPYSYRTVNEDGTVSYTEYNRADPVGMFFGIAADVGQALAFRTEQEKDETAMMLTVALLNNLNNKSYLSGLVQAVGAFAEPDRRAFSYSKNLLGAAVPNLLNQQFKDDPHMREARTYVDALLARTPGYSETVDPQRNIFGEEVHVPATLGPEWLSPVMPIVSTQHMGGAQPLTEEWRHNVQSDPGDELARQMWMQDSAIRPPPKSIGDLDLTKVYVDGHQYSAYDKWVEMHGTVKIAGRTLKEEVARVIASKDYREKMTDGNLEDNGARMKTLSAIFGAYRERAEYELMKANPEIAAAFQAEKRKKALWMTQKGQQQLRSEQQ